MQFFPNIFELYIWLDPWMKNFWMQPADNRIASCCLSKFIYFTFFSIVNEFFHIKWEKMSLIFVDSSYIQPPYHICLIIVGVLLESSGFSSIKYISWKIAFYFKMFIAVILLYCVFALSKNSLAMLNNKGNTRVPYTFPFRIMFSTDFQLLLLLHCCM